MLNGGLGPIRNPPSLWLGTFLCGSLVFFSAGALTNSGVRRLVLRPDTELLRVRRDLLLVSVIGSILFLSCAMSLARQWVSDSAELPNKTMEPTR
jgi:hypothetical protein